jgi:hypothetical protein
VAVSVGRWTERTVRARGNVNHGHPERAAGSPHLNGALSSPARQSAAVTTRASPCGYVLRGPSSRLSAADCNFAQRSGRAAPQEADSQADCNMQQRVFPWLPATIQVPRSRARLQVPRGNPHPPFRLFKIASCCCWSVSSYPPHQRCERPTYKGGSWARLVARLECDLWTA